MKNPERVAELLAELRELADNDFERHRIDVLEKDLTNPPTIEVIDDKHQCFLGEIYAERANGGHYASNNTLHRVVWAYHNGEIPDGYHIHHVDRNTANNDISNLQCLPAAEHRQIHATNQRYEKTCAICGEKFLSKVKSARYCSSSCAHKSTTYEKSCKHCGKKFTTTHKEAEFCSTLCANNASERHIKTKRSCKYCGKDFWGGRKFCSSTCASYYSRAKKPTEERICVICGKKFKVRHNQTKQTCSPSCATKLNWQHRRDIKN